MRKRVRAARGYGWPREWVLTAVLAEADWFRLVSKFKNELHRTTPPEMGVYTSSGGLSKERS